MTIMHQIPTYAVQFNDGTFFKYVLHDGKPELQRTTDLNEAFKSSHISYINIVLREVGNKNEFILRELEINYKLK